MKNKESWYVKIIKFFYGVRDDLDEYRIQEINRIGNNSFMMLVTYSFVITILDNFLPYLIGFKTTLITTIFINWLALLIVLIYGSQSIQKLNLNQIDAYDEDDYKIWVQKTKLRAVLLSIIFFLFYRFGTIGFDLVQGASFLHELTSLSSNVTGLIITIVFGISVYYSMKKQIKR